MLNQKTKAKQFLPLIMAIVMAVSFIGSDVFTVRAKAASKWDGYTKITTYKELYYKIIDNPKGKYYLANDIDLKDAIDGNGENNWPGIGTKYDPFEGTFDGNGFAIKNLKSKYGGLFSYIRDATIKNLGLLNVDINVESQFGSVGALADFSNDSYPWGETPKGSYIENCYVTGKIEGTYNAAGLVGKASYTEFKNCLNSADISRCDSGSGIVGSTGSSNYGYYNCINFGKIGGAQTAGITKGSLYDADFIGCFNIGKVGPTNETILVKVNYGAELVYNADVTLDSNDNTDVVIKDCGYLGKYANGDISYNKAFKKGINLLALGSDKMTKSELKKKETYKGWDFDKVWYMDSKINNGYPILQIMLRNYNASKPVSDTKSGEYEKGTKINLSTELKGVTIYYTTNGKAPTTSSTKYTGAITISKDTTIKAAVFTNKGKIRGRVETFTYTYK